MSEGGLHGVLFKRERDVRRERRLPILSGGEESELLLLLALLSFADGQSLSGSVQERGRKKTTSLSTAEEEESEKNCVLFGSVADGRRSLLSALLIVPSEKESDSPSFFLSPLRFISLSSLRGAIATRIHLRTSLSLSGSSCPRKKQKREGSKRARENWAFSLFAMPPQTRSPTSTSSSSSSSLLAPGVAAKLALASAALVLLPSLAWTAARAGKLDGARDSFLEGGGLLFKQRSVSLSLSLFSLFSPLFSFVKRKKNSFRLPAPRQHPIGRLETPCARRRGRRNRGQLRDASLRFGRLGRGSPGRKWEHNWRTRRRGEKDKLNLSPPPLSSSSQCIKVFSPFSN